MNVYKICGRYIAILKLEEGGVMAYGSTHLQAMKKCLELAEKRQPVQLPINFLDDPDGTALVPA